MSKGIDDNDNDNTTVYYYSYNDKYWMIIFKHNSYDDCKW